VDNWTAALGEAAAAGADRTVVEVAESMHWFSDRRSGWRCWVEVFGWSSTAAQRLGDGRLEAVHRNYLSWALTLQQRHDEAARTAERAGALARAAGDVREEAWAHRYAADARGGDRPGGEGDPVALEHHLRAAELFTRVGDVMGLLTSQAGAGRELGRLGRHAEGLALLDQVLAALEDPATDVPQHILGWQHIVILGLRGGLLADAGDLSAAEASLRAAVARAEHFGAPALRARSWHLLGEVLRAQGRSAESRVTLLHARAHYVSAQRDRRVAEVDAALAVLG
jgi:tetratricopeptide (TPR) repeat protein